MTNLELWSEIEKYFIKLLEEFDIPLSFEETENIDGLLKLLNIHIEEEHENYLEKLVDYIDILTKLCNIKVVVINNIRACLSIEDIKALYQLAFLRKWSIVCLDYMEPVEKLDDEEYYVIDNDLCEIF